MPELRRNGAATQLVVDKHPFLILGGELGNSTAASIETMRPVWAKLAALHVNTVLVPVYWELMEPEEGRFDFVLVDYTVTEARRNGLRVVPLWFGTFKNSMACYAPGWIKTDSKRFPKARIQSGRAVDILSPFGDATRDADARAFAALMRHIRSIDEGHETVVLVQVENEIGMLESARDHSELANAAFGSMVPGEFVKELDRLDEALALQLRNAWRRAGRRMSGTWEEVLGPGIATDEIFMAWHFARYVEHVAAAGKAEYPIPMFVNAALNRPGHEPGRYPSAGPLPHLFDVWRAAAPSVDFFSPDIYFPNVAGWCDAYYRPRDNPLFVPEASNDGARALDAFYAIGQTRALGYSPFSIENVADDAPLGRAFEVLSRLSSLILEAQAEDKIAGALLDREAPTREILLGGYRLTFSHDHTWEWSSGRNTPGPWPPAAGLVCCVGPGEYLVAGSGIIVTFAPESPGDPVGIASVDEGTYDNGRWITKRRLNGDETHQGRQLRIPPDQIGMQRVTLYRYA